MRVQEKMLVISIFSLSDNAYTAPLGVVKSQDCVKELRLVPFVDVGHDGKILFINPFPNKPWILRVCSTSLLKTLQEKEKLLVTSNFSFPTMFSTRLKNFLPISSNSKLSSANSFTLKILRLGKG